jgi:hypothetical protein
MFTTQIPASEIPSFISLKLDLLKVFLIDKIFDLELRAQVKNINSIGGIWCFLFKNNLYEVYSKLNAEGIYPIASELNESQLDGINAWNHLVRSKESIYIFEEQINRGVYPSSTALDECCKSDNYNAWNNLAHWGIGIPVFQTLLEKGILPSQKALDACNIANNCNVWRALACIKQRIPVFKTLLDKGILPSSKALD